MPCVDDICGQKMLQALLLWSLSYMAGTKNNLNDDNHNSCNIAPLKQVCRVLSISKNNS